MELQLGLGLPIPSKGFDLNSYGYEPKEVLVCDPLDHRDHHPKKKRSFDEAFEVQKADIPQTLPLLVWNNLQSNVEHDLIDLEETNSFAINERIDGDEDGIIGWPPIKSCRKNLCHQKHGSSAANYWTIENGGGGGSNSTYVKVKMEGVAIARKVDISLHHSYQTLTHTLVGMFGKCQENVKAYKLTYQDREGDWLLAADLPWGTFIRSVQRIKVLKNIG